MGPEKFQIGTIKLNFTGLSKENLQEKHRKQNYTAQNAISTNKQQNDYLLLMQFNTGVDYFGNNLYRIWILTLTPILMKILLICKVQLIIIIRSIQKNCSLYINFYLVK